MGRCFILYIKKGWRNLYFESIYAVKLFFHINVKIMVREKMNGLLILPLIYGKEMFLYFCTFYAPKMGVYGKENGRE